MIGLANNFHVWRWGGVVVVRVDRLNGNKVRVDRLNGNKAKINLAQKS